MHQNLIQFAARLSQIQSAGGLPTHERTLAALLHDMASDMTRSVPPDISELSNLKFICCAVRNGVADWV